MHTCVQSQGECIYRVDCIQIQNNINRFPKTQKVIVTNNNMHVTERGIITSNGTTEKLCNKLIYFLNFLIDSYLIHSSINFIIMILERVYFIMYSDIYIYLLILLFLYSQT